MSEREWHHAFTCAVCGKTGECDGDCDDPDDDAHVHYGECSERFRG